MATNTTPSADLIHQPAAGVGSAMFPVCSVKELLNLPSLPSCYIHSEECPISEPCDSGNHLDDRSIPVIDFSLLMSDDPDTRSKMIEALGKACQDWGFFMVVNHGLPMDLMESVLDGCGDFFNLSTEQKREFQGKHVLDPIRCGTSHNASVDKTYFWRDYLKAFVHPQFHFPDKPFGFSELAKDYSSGIKKVTQQLHKAISVSLGLEPCYIEKALHLEQGLQVFIANMYPPCPQPELALGISPHSDHGLLTVLIQNGIGGLQIMHNGKWIPVNPIPNSILVNTADQLEILSNGRYKSVLHRALVNGKATRISIAVANGPSLDAMVGPAPELLDDEQNHAVYKPMTYKEYMQLQQSNQVSGKSALDRAKIMI